MATVEPTQKLSGTYSEVQDQLRARGWNADKLQRIDLSKKLSDNPWDTDKVVQKYMPVYEKIARELGTSANICELGVWLGGSLATWQVLFPQGIVAGVDLWEGAGWPDGSEKIVMGQEDPELPSVLKKLTTRWDIIIDDCSHEATPTLTSFRNLWPLVRPGGYYVIEDWFYGWHEGQILTAYNMLDLAKDLLEELDGNKEATIEEIRYRYGLIIIQKGVGNWHPEQLVELRKRYSNTESSVPLNR